MELRLLVAPQHAEGADALAEGAVALRPRHRAVVGQLLLVPPDPDAEQEPSAREPVQGRDRLGQIEQVVLEGQGHPGAEQQIPRRGGGEKQREERVDHPLVLLGHLATRRVGRAAGDGDMRVLPDPERVVPRALSSRASVGREVGRIVHGREPETHAATVGDGIVEPDPVTAPPPVIICEAPTVTNTEPSKQATFLRTILEPPRTAVLTMELQEGVVGSGALLPALGEEVERVGLLEAVRRLCGAARDVGARVVHCTAVTRPDGAGGAQNCKIFALGERMRRQSGVSPTQIGTPGAALVAGLEDRATSSCRGSTA